MIEEQDYVARVDTPPRRKRVWAVLGAIGMAASGIAAAAVVTGGSSPASGDPTTNEWTTFTLVNGWQHSQEYSPNYPLQYLIDDDGWVHIRGSIVSGGSAVVERDNPGPWMSDVSSIPEGFRPKCRVGQVGMVNDVYGVTGYHGGLGIEPDGTIKTFTWDAPTATSGGDAVIGAVVTVNFEYDTDTGVECSPTTTTTTLGE